MDIWAARSATKYHASLTNRYILDSSNNAALEMAYNDSLTAAANLNVNLPSELPEKFACVVDAYNKTQGLPLRFEFYTATSKRTAVIHSTTMVMLFKR